MRNTAARVHVQKMAIPADLAQPVMYALDVSGHSMSRVWMEDFISAWD